MGNFVIYCVKLLATITSKDISLTKINLKLKKKRQKGMQNKKREMLKA